MPKTSLESSVLIIMIAGLFQSYGSKRKGTMNPMSYWLATSKCSMCCGLFYILTITDVYLQLGWAGLSHSDLTNYPHTPHSAQKHKGKRWCFVAGLQLMIHSVLSIFWYEDIGTFLGHCILPPFSFSCYTLPETLT